MHKLFIRILDIVIDEQVIRTKLHMIIAFINSLDLTWLNKN